MAETDYPFIDIAVLDGVRERFLAGDALVALSIDLERIIWANGAGATLFGYADIAAARGAASGLGFAARRQISATPGFPAIGGPRALLVRIERGLTSRAVGFLASAMSLPGGEPALLLAAPDAESARRPAGDTAARIIHGLGGDDHQAALVDSAGVIEAASAGFAALNLNPEALAALVAEVSTEEDRLAKRMIPGGDSLYPAGIARLADMPARHLVLVVDDPIDAVDADDVADTDAGEAMVVAGGATAADPAVLPEPPAPAPSLPAPAGQDDDGWYFDDAPPVRSAPAAMLSSSAMPDVVPVEDAPPIEAPEAIAADMSAGDEADPESKAEALATEPAPDLEFVDEDLFPVEATEPDEDWLAEQAVADAALPDVASPVALEPTQASPDLDFVDEDLFPVEATEADEDWLAEQGVAETTADDPVRADEMPADASAEKAQPAADLYIVDEDPIAVEAAQTDADRVAANDETVDADDAWHDAEETPSVADAPAALDPVEPASPDAEPAMQDSPVTAAAPDEHDDAASGISETLPDATPAPPMFTPDLSSGPVRFVWRTDADGCFSMISEEFAKAVGPAAAEIVGRPFDEVARQFGLDPDQEIAGLMSRRDTWSGRSVLWPIAGTDLRAPVDLAALPVYARDRSFEGFRGFGVVRIGDALVDVEATGLGLGAMPQPDAAPATEPAPEQTSEQPATDPFNGEMPAIAVDETPRRRLMDKVIRLAEHRPSGNERSLTPGETIAFREIGQRLRDSDAPEPSTSEAGTRTDEGAGDGEDPEPESGETPAVSELTPDSGVWSATDDPSDAAAAALVATDADADDDADGDDDPSDPSGAPVEPEATAAGGDVSDDDFASGDGADSATSEIAEQIRPAEARPDAHDADEPEHGIAPSTEPESIAEALDQADRDPSIDDEPDSETTATDDALAAVDHPAKADADVETAGGSETADVADTDPDVAAAEMLATSFEDSDAADDADRPVAADADETLDTAVGGDDAGDDVEPQASPVSDGDFDAPEYDGFPDSDAEPGCSAQDTSILARLPVPVLIHSGDTLHYANEAFFELTGYVSLLEFEQEGGLEALFAENAEGAEDADHRRHLRTRDGDEFPVEALLQSVPWGEGKALLLALKPAAQTPAAPAPIAATLDPELEARVAEMHAILDTATDGIVIINADGSIRSISRPAEALFGFDTETVAGKPFVSLFAVESQRAARDYLGGLSGHGVASVLNDGREVIGREAQGRFIPLFMTIGRLPGGNGYCAVLRDITQWKRAEEELTQARAEAERGSSQKTEFLARISHEIRTPLNAIIGFSELMIDEKFGPIVNERYRDYLRDINRSGNHVLDLVNDLLDISKIEAGQLEMDYEAVSLNDTLAEAVAMMQPQANRERVIIRSSFASRLPEVVADLRSIRQIALNLLSNAVRYTQAGGQVIVSTAYEPSGDVVMRVRDTGVGMSQAEIEQALKPFRQINALKRSRGDGTGLGLPLTKAMVEANRARFSISSTPSEGTLVEIVFPSTRVLAG